MARTSAWMATAALVAALGCGSGGETAPEPGGSEGGEQRRAGGSTGDFSGDAERCEAESEVALDDDALLGFAGQTLLDFARGRYEMPIRWATACTARRACSDTVDCEPEPDATGLAGTDTVLTLEVEPRGSTVHVEHPTDAQELCARTMQVPVRVRLSSADGALADELFDAEIWTERGDTADIALERPVAELNGSLRNAAGALEPGAALALSFGFYGAQVWLETELYEPAAGAQDERRVVLADLLAPATECTLEVPRADVDRTDPGRPAPASPNVDSNGISD